MGFHGRLSSFMDISRNEVLTILRKKGKLDTSHRYDLLPLLRSSPGGIQRELVVYDFPDCKGSHFFCIAKNNDCLFSITADGHTLRACRGSDTVED